MTAAATEVPILTTSEEALAAADRIAALIGPGAAERDRLRTEPREALAAIKASGLLGIAVPQVFDGPELPRVTIVEVFRRIARADSSVAQLLLTHFVVQEVLRTSPSTEPAARIYADILAGAQLGNAFSERSGKSPDDWSTTIVPADAGQWLLTGRKFYATGALGADWIAVGALREGKADHRVHAFVKPDQAGVTLELGDWNGFGQRTTFSGSVILQDVIVDDALVRDDGPIPDDLPPGLFGSYDQAIHTAIDVGIARAALEDAAAFIVERGRARGESGVDRLSDEPHVQRRIGELTARLSALEALLERGARAVDTAVEAPELTGELAATASLRVAEAKALTVEFGNEIASSVLELAGTSATDEAHGLDRHWRNIRTHSLHDPARFKLVAIGRHTLTGEQPPRDWLI